MEPSPEPPRKRCRGRSARRAARSHKAMSRAASAWDMGPGSSACRRRTSSCPAISADRAAGLLQGLPMTLGRMAVSSRRALCSAPQEGKLHQASPQPCMPSSSSRRSRTAGLSCMMPNEVRTAFSMGALKTKISAERTGAVTRSVAMVFPLADVEESCSQLVY